jgi:hypothetical protein
MKQAIVALRSGGVDIGLPADQLLALRDRLKFNDVEEINSELDGPIDGRVGFLVVRGSVRPRHPYTSEA